ncbi:MAG: hypothetical protein ACTSQI_04220 [Candidatus Helarchaeota archaeon]
MKGILLCKFDEEKGYIPIKAYPPKIRKRSHMELFKKIARNAIGFGTDIEFQAFTLAENSSEIHCLAKRFSIPVEGARGGSELYALVLFGETEEFPKTFLGESTDRLKANWESRSEIMESLYSIYNPPKTSIPTTDLSIGPENLSQPIFPSEYFIKKEGRFASGHTLSRNFLMLLALGLMFWVLYSNYELFSFGFMIVTGIFIFSIIAKKDTPLKIVNGFLFFFIVLLFLKLLVEIIGNPIEFSFLSAFPDFTRPDLALWSFISGILISFGLDRGDQIEKPSFIIGICGIIFFILFFLTPVFEIFAEWIGIL